MRNGSAVTLDCTVLLHYPMGNSPRSPLLDGRHVEIVCSGSTIQGMLNSVVVLINWPVIGLFLLFQIHIFEIYQA